MKTEDFVRGWEVAFEDLRVGEWYFDDDGDVFHCVGRSLFTDEVLSDYIDRGAMATVVLHGPFRQALPKRKVEYRRSTVGFYFYDSHKGSKTFAARACEFDTPWRNTIAPTATATIEVGSDGSVRIVQEGEA